MMLPVLVTFLLPFVLAHEPEPVPGNASTSTPNCTNVTDVSPSCFNTLTASFYLSEIWNTSIRLETCSPSQLWSTCFFNRAFSLAIPGTTYTAANITKNDCSLLKIAPSNDTYLGPAVTAAAGNTTIGSCPSLEGFANPPPLPGGIAEIAAQTQAGNFNIRIFYIIFVIISVHDYFSAWASALLSPVVAPTLSLITSIRKGQSPGQVLGAVISTYGIEKEADGALQSLLMRPSGISPVPGAGLGAAAAAGAGSAGASAVTATTTGQQGEVTAEMMVQKLSETLKLVMRDIDVFVELTGTGVFANQELPGFERLVEALS